MIESAVLRRPLPREVAVVLAAVLSFGFAAAYVALPSLWWVTILVAVAIIASWLSSGAYDADAYAVELPRTTRHRVRDAFRALPPGEPANLLREVVRPARSLFSVRPRDVFPQSMLRDCSELVEAACETAIELDRLDHLLTRDVSSLQSRDQRALRDDVTAARQMLTARLATAGVTLAELYVQSVESGMPPAERLHELAQELSAELAARRAATAELEALLR